MPLPAGVYIGFLHTMTGAWARRLICVVAAHWWCATQIFAALT
jgi:hypothetical protein